MARDDKTVSLVERVLEDPALFPDSFKSWLPRFLNSNVNLKIGSVQLPNLDLAHYVGNQNEISFLNSWVNYGAGYDGAMYFKDPWGIVHLSGLIKLGTMGAAAFNLPGGYRPAGRLIFPTIDSAGAGNIIGGTDVTGTGDVIPVTGGNAYVSLSGISFRAAA